MYGADAYALAASDAFGEIDDGAVVVDLDRALGADVFTFLASQTAADACLACL